MRKADEEQLVGLPGEASRTRRKEKRSRGREKAIVTPSLGDTRLCVIPLTHLS